MPQKNPLVVIQSPVLYLETTEIKKVIKVLDTYKNLEWLLQHFKADIRYNLMTRRREIIIPNQFIFKGDIENSALSQVEYLATLNGMPNKNLDSHLNKISHENTYHPIIEAMQKTPWDGIARVDKFIDALVFKHSADLARKIIRVWMTAAMAAAHSEDGFINQGVLVLQGEQKIGKTSWVKALDPFNCGAVKESAFLDPTNKDSVSLLASYWIAELGELDSIFKKSEIGRLKSFITSQFDDVRLPYARKSTRLSRRTAYVATVNDMNFLVDDTGNRRWWTVQVESINFDHGLDIQQVWAEIYHHWKNGAPVDLDFETQGVVNERNKSHEKFDPIKEKIMQSYDWESTNTRWLTTTQVLMEIGYPRPNRAEATHAGKILTSICGNNIGSKGGCTRYRVPLLIISSRFPDY